MQQGLAHPVIRSFQPADADACRHLYLEGLIGGQIADNDTGMDIDDIQAAYMSSPGSHCWVAQVPGSDIVGMIGVQHYEDDEGEIRRLRVRADHRRRGIGTMLVETAVRFCQDHQYLKIKLDTFMEREPAVKLFEKFHFKLSRDRNVGSKNLLYFYLDLYTQESKQKKE